MSDGLIRRSDAIKAVSKVDDYGDGIGFEVRSHCLVELELVPSADRPQGEWNPYYTKRENNDIFNCKLCGTTFIVMQGKDNMNFCPNCGAKMKGADDENNH